MRALVAGFAVRLLAAALLDLDPMHCSGAFPCTLQSRVGVRSSLRHINAVSIIHSSRWRSSRPCPSHDNSSRQQDRTVASAAAAASPPSDKHRTTTANSVSSVGQRSVGRQSKASVWSVLQDLLQLLVDVARHKFVFNCAAALLLLLFSKVAGLQAPLYIKTFVDQALTGAASAAVQSRPEVLAATCVVVSLIFKELIYPVFSPVSAAVAELVASKIYAHILSLDIQTLTELNPQDVSNAMTRCKSSIKTLYYKVGLTALPALAEVLFVGFWLSSLGPFQWGVGAVVVATWAVYVGVSFWACQAPVTKQKEATKAADAASKQAQNTISPGALKQVKLSNSQDYEREKYDKLSKTESEKSLDCNVAYAQVAIVQHLILGIGLVAVMSAARLFTTTAATSGELALLYSLLLRLLWPLHQFGSDIREGSKALSNIQGALEILDTKSKEHSGTIPVPDWPPSLAQRGQAEMSAPVTAGTSSFNGSDTVHVEQRNGPSSSSSSSSSSGSSMSQTPTAQVPPARLPGLEVELRDVWFTHQRTARSSQGPEEQEVLRGASIHILSGERVGVKGRSGAGKTTMLDLILVFLRVAAGRGTVLVNGVDSRDLMLTSLWGSTALVSQDPEAQLRDATILDNIRSSRRNASDEEVKAAAKVAQLEGLVEELGDSMIGEGGSKLSKGQRQRIAIASAILKRPCLLVLDEPTSNLDYDTEAEILDNLKYELTQGTLKGCTCIIVSHRPSALELLGCDRVVELTDEGTLKEVRQRCSRAAAAAAAPLCKNPA